jgi:hypothetical protein
MRLLRRISLRRNPDVTVLYFARHGFVHVVLKVSVGDRNELFIRVHRITLLRTSQPLIMTITVMPSVIERSEAIHAGTEDCFVPRNDGGGGQTVTSSVSANGVKPSMQVQRIASYLAMMRAAGRL